MKVTFDLPETSKGIVLTLVFDPWDLPDSTTLSTYSGKPFDGLVVTRGGTGDGEFVETTGEGYDGY